MQAASWGSSVLFSGEGGPSQKGGAAQEEMFVLLLKNDIKETERNTVKKMTCARASLAAQGCRLPTDLQDLCYSYLLQLRVSQINAEILDAVPAESLKSQISLCVRQSWEEWNRGFSPRMFQPDKYAPGGTQEWEFLNQWRYKFLRRPTWHYELRRRT